MMSHLKTLISLVFVASFLGVQCQLQDELQQVFDDNELMGMSVVKICGTEIESYTYGLKDYDRELPVDDSTMYRIASISKLITAMGMMKLYEEGAFELDDDVNDALGWELRNPSFPSVPITYRMLLSHTSSIQDGTGYSGFLSATYNFSDSPPSIQELLQQDGDYFTTNMFRTEAPGTFFAYSNLNFGIIGSLIEALSGVRFDVYMRTNILEPLSIAGSYNVADIENIDNVAVLYRNQGGWTPQADNYQGNYPTPLDLSQYVLGTNGLVFAPQGGLRVSAIDLARIVLIHLFGEWNGVQVLQPETIELMNTPQWTYNGSNGDNYYGLFRQWGLGVHCTTATANGDLIFQNELYHGHPGEAYGLISDMYWNIGSDHYGFVFLTNGAYNGYDFGNQSAYYTTEEDVFSALHNNNFWECVLGINSPFEQESITVYPNPAHDVVTIDWPNGKPANSIRLHNSMGKEITVNSTSIDSACILDVEGIPAGTYVLTLEYADRACMVKLNVLEH